MPYSKEIFDAANRRLEERRRAAEAENNLTRQELYAKIPRLAQIERQLAGTAIHTVREILSGGDSTRKIEALKKTNLDLQAERAELLSASGYPPGILAVNHYCDKCGDTGYVGNHICTCLETLLREEACKLANFGSPLPLFEFSTFDLGFYPTERLAGSEATIRDYMGRVFSYCKNYASGFAHGKPSLLLLGNTGLGKTHLSLAIANAVLAKGYGVIYNTAQNIFSRVEDEYFGRSEKEYTPAIYGCDLLIIDELPDYASQFSINALYNIINTRALARRPIIVSTNLSETDLSARYGQRIFSRLIGDFALLKFFGNDIRQLKLKQKGKI